MLVFLPLFGAPWSPGLLANRGSAMTISADFNDFLADRETVGR